MLVWNVVSHTCVARHISHTYSKMLNNMLLFGYVPTILGRGYFLIWFPPSNNKGMLSPSHHSHRKRTPFGVCPSPIASLEVAPTICKLAVIRVSRFYRVLKYTHVLRNLYVSLWVECCWPVGSTPAQLSGQALSERTTQRCIYLSVNKVVLSKVRNGVLLRKYQ